MQKHGESGGIRHQTLTGRNMKSLRSWWNSDIVLLIRRIVLLYIVLAVCRIAFYLLNKDAVGPISCQELLPLLRGALRFDTVSILYGNALFILLSLFPTHLRERKWWRGILFGYYMVINSLAVALNLADAIYFRYTRKRFTSDEIFFADNDNSLQLIGKFMAENLPLVILFGVLVWLLWTGYRRKTVPNTPIRRQWVYYLFGTSTLLAAAVLTVGGIRGGFSRSTRPITLSNATQYTPSPMKANLVLSNPFCVIRTMGNEKISYHRYFDEQTLEKYITPIHRPPEQPSGTTVLKGRNLVIFVLESFSAEHSARLNPDLYPDGKGFTPFLDSLMGTGLTFTSAYANGRKSIEALPSVLGSIPSFKKPFVLLPQSLAETRQLPAILAGEGYETAFFCGSPRGSMGFGAYAISAGIEHLFGQEDYEKIHGKGDFDGYWGIWDEPFIDYMGEELSQMRQPFMCTLFTLSSHHPFVVPQQYADLPAGKTKIHKGVQYTDLAIRNFFHKYGDQEWFHNTVFVFVADHVSSETFAPETRTVPGQHRIIQFIYTPDGAVSGQIDQPVQQIDLMPTLLGLFGYDKPYFAYGRDLMNEPERMHLAVGYSTGTMSFFAISDRYLILFDEEKITATYSLDDKLMNTPLNEPWPKEIDSMETQLKAIIQQYYRHLEQKNYTVQEYPAEP